MGKGRAGISGLLVRKRWRRLLRRSGEARSPTVSVCILLLRLLKHHFFMQHKHVAANLLLCEKYIGAVCSLQTLFIYLFNCASITPQCVLGRSFSKMH